MCKSRCKPGTTPQWEPFPVGELPRPYSTFVADTARARQCDEAAVALPLLAAIASAIGNARIVRIWPDWSAPAVLWTAIVAPSGATKSPAFRAAMATLEEIEGHERIEWNRSYAAYETERGRYEADLAIWRSKRDNRDALPEAPVKPTLPRAIVEDTTVQALGQVLKENPRGVLLARDELSGWVRSFDQFTSAVGADVARWLEIHSARPLRVDRKADGHLYVPRAAVSICGTIQTGILLSVFNPKHIDAGLLARFLLANPPERPRQWTAGRSASAPDTSELLRHFQVLRELDLPSDGQKPRALELSAEAATMFGVWFETHEARHQATEQGPWRAAQSKLEELPARLALILALARADDPLTVTDVDGDTMRRAIALTEWFVAEGHRIYVMMSETSANKADRELVDWVAQSTDGVSARDAAKNLRRYRGPGGSDRAEADLSRLCAEDHLESEQVRGRRGPPCTLYHAPRGCADTFQDDDDLDRPTMQDGHTTDADRFPDFPAVQEKPVAVGTRQNYDRHEREKLVGGTDEKQPWEVEL